MPYELEVLPLRLRNLRESRRLTQTDLAAEIGANKVQISRYESGLTTPNAGNLARLAELFECSVDYLLGLTDVAHGPIGETERLSFEEWSLVRAFRERRFSRLMHLVASSMETEEAKRDQLIGAVAALDGVSRLKSQDVSQWPSNWSSEYREFVQYLLATHQDDELTALEQFRKDVAERQMSYFEAQPGESDGGPESNPLGGQIDESPG